MVLKLFGYLRNIGFLSAGLLFCYLINPLNYGFVFGYFLIILIVLKKDFISRNLDFNFLIIIIFSVCYGLFYGLDPEAGTQFIIVYSFTPAFLYLWGKYLAFKSNNDLKLFYLLFTLGLIFSTPHLISVLINIAEGGLAQDSRSIPMFWGSEAKNATGMAAPFILNMCIPAVLLAHFKKLSIPFKVLMVVVFVLTLVCVLRLGSRTQLVIFLMTFLLTLFYMVPRQSLKQNISLFVILSIGIYFIFRNVSFDLDQDWLTSFAGRMQQNNGTGDIASGGGRTDKWVKSFEYIFKKPLGWDVEEFGYSHNLWFDTLRVGGIISFTILLVFSWKSFVQVLKVIKSAPTNVPFNIFIFSYFVSFNLLFMVEPILDGSFQIFTFFCLFMGVINKYYSMNFLFR